MTAERVCQVIDEWEAARPTWRGGIALATDARDMAARGRRYRD